MIKTKASFSNKVSERELKNREIAYEAATESIVLLKNTGVLPIMPCKLALYGSGAAINIKGGTGSGEVNERHSIGIKEGLETAGFQIGTTKWLEAYKKNYEEGKVEHGKGLLKKLLIGSADDKINIMANPYRYPFGEPLEEVALKAMEADTCIYVIARQAGECSDRSMAHYDYELSPLELQNIQKAAIHFAKVIIVINVGGSMDISALEKIENIGAILYYCQQGMEGGRALADILTGKVTPSGCLTDTWALRYADIPYADQFSYLNGNVTDEDYQEGIYVGYRYFDSFHKEVRYEFGYGMSYTEFDILPVSVINNQHKIIVEVKVTNIGKQYAGKKVVQLYVSCPKGILDKEYQNLAAFGKTKLLAPQESQILSLEMDMTLVASYHEKTSEFILDSGKYILRVGATSRQTKVCGVVHLNERVVTEKCSPVCEPQRKIELLNNPDPTQEFVTEGITEIIMKVNEFTTKIHNDQMNDELLPIKVQELFDNLTDDEILQLVIGTGIMDNKATFIVPGCAAYTASIPAKKIANMVLCDGPAGVRVQRMSVLIRNKKLKPVEPMMEFLGYLPPFALKWILGDPKQGKLMYQYATAFPVGTALAQTWNMALLEKVGDAVGKEMVAYGVTFWLAPGMNIHRNPLCGRNYEYFSEDPILTGKCASSITKGVQKHDGCYVTLKHFAANNQETNRNHMSSNITERVLREIYLKGFQMAVRESHAKSVMTSYNRLNGQYTSTSSDLIQKILRQEWGFDGVVMTDWFATGEGLADNAQTILAGVDLIMPGGKKVFKELKDHIRKGTIHQQDIDIACKRVLAALVESHSQKEFYSN